MTFQFWWHFSFGNISVLVTFQFRWHFSFIDISALVTFSFGDISVLVSFQFWWHLSFGDIWVLVIFWTILGCSGSWLVEGSTKMAIQCGQAKTIVAGSRSATWQPQDDHHQHNIPQYSQGLLKANMIYQVTPSPPIYIYLYARVTLCVHPESPLPVCQEIWEI